MQKKKTFRVDNESGGCTIRQDDGWKTIKGTHVLVDDEGRISGGPQSLKDFSAKKYGAKSSRPQRGHLAKMGKAKDRVAQIKADTGFSDEDAKYADAAIQHYASENSFYIRNPKTGKFDESAAAEIINRYLEAAPAYPVSESSPIYRGISLQPGYGYTALVKRLKVGDTFTCRAQGNWQDSKDRRPSSWSSNVSVANKTADSNIKIDKSYYNKIDGKCVFRCTSASKAVSITHLSTYGMKEYEVMTPASSVFRVTGVQKSKLKNGADSYLIDLEEVE